MSFIEYRNLLTTIGRSLEELDRTYLLYLCEGKIQAGNEQNIYSVLKLFKEMEAKNTLGIDRLENLKELLRVLEKWRLFEEVRKFEMKRKKYNDLLQQTSEALDGSIEMERLIFICRGKILKEREGNINDTRSLFRELETQNNLEFSRLDILKEVLNSVQKEDLLRKVEEFERWRNDEDESACRGRGGERADMFAHERSLGERAFGGAKPRRKNRKNSDSALSTLPNDDEVILVKLKQLEKAFKLQQEKIAILEKKVEMRPKLFLQTENPQTANEKGKDQDIKLHVAAPKIKELGERDSDSGISIISESSDIGIEGSVSGFELEMEETADQDIKQHVAALKIEENGESGFDSSDSVQATWE